MRVSGFASGMDIDTIVKNMMAAKRIPLDKMNQQKERLQWQRDSYREINSKLVDFRNNKLLKYGLATEMNTQKAVVQGDTSSVKAEALPTANGVPMTVTVTQLASKANILSDALMVGTDTGSERAKLSTKVRELFGGSTGEDYKININDTTITISGDKTIKEALSIINGDKKANVTASFDEISGRLSITSNEYGKEITMDSGSTFFDLIKVKDSHYHKAEDAKFNIKTPEDTVGVDLTSASNSYTINGMKLSFLAVTESGKSTLVTTDKDSTKALDTIKAFVQNYNELLNLLNTKVGEERYRDFLPLTDEQKQDMKEADIKRWEEKARSGLLKNDEVLKSTISKMRTQITEKLGDLSSIGITTGKYFENGKLYLDEEKLKGALQDNPQKVADIFQGPASAPNDGLLDKLAVSMNEALDSLVLKAGTSKHTADLNSAYKEESVIGKKLKDYNQRVSAMQMKLQDLEIRYYKQFTAMEMAINKYNTQSSSLSGLLAN